MFIPFSPCCPRGDITWKHNLTPQFHSFSSIRSDWNFPAHFPGAVKWAVSHVSELALLICSNTSHSLLYGSVWVGLSTQTPAASPLGRGVIDNISPALHTHAHLYSWLEKGPWCPLTSTVPIIPFWYMPGMGSFPFIKYSATAGDRSLVLDADICISRTKKTQETGSGATWN